MQRALKWDGIRSHAKWCQILSGREDQLKDRSGLSSWGMKAEVLSRLNSMDEMSKMSGMCRATG